jgi:hypothetical protein
MICWLVACAAGTVTRERAIMRGTQDLRQAVGRPPDIMNLPCATCCARINKLFYINVTHGKYLLPVNKSIESMFYVVMPLSQ